MSDRTWIIRPSETLRLALAVSPHDRPRQGDQVRLERLDAKAGTIEISGLLLQIGQPVALMLADGETLKGSVRSASDHQAVIGWDHPLTTIAVRAFRMRHMGFLSDIPNLDLKARRSVA